jgi:hypothetical protein
MKSAVVWITVAFIFAGCAHQGTLNSSTQTSFSFQTNSSQTRILLDPVGKDISRILILTLDNDKIVNSRAALLPWPIYQFGAGDIDEDNITDLFVGVIKACPYDPVVRRRLFVYEVIDGDIRSKWRGTHVSYDLLEFRIIHLDGKTRILSLEQDKAGLYHIVTYAWASFGPRLINNQTGGKNYEKAFEIFNSDSFFSPASDMQLSKSGNR